MRCHLNMPMQYTAIAISKAVKIDYFQMKNCDIFAQNIDCGYSMRRF